jgi:hypothetical protein
LVPGTGEVGDIAFLPGNRPFTPVKYQPESAVSRFPEKY